MIEAHLNFGSSLNHGTIELIDTHSTLKKMGKRMDVGLLYQIQTTHPKLYDTIVKSNGVSIRFDQLANTAYVEIDPAKKKTFVTMTQLTRHVPLADVPKVDYTLADVEVRCDGGYVSSKQGRWSFSKCKVAMNGNALTCTDGAIFDFEDCTFVDASLGTERVGDLGGQIILTRCTFTAVNSLTRVSVGGTTFGVNGNIYLKQTIRFLDCDFSKTSVRITCAQEAYCEFIKCNFVPFGASPEHPNVLIRYDDRGNVSFSQCKFPDMMAFPPHDEYSDFGYSLTGKLKKSGLAIKQERDRIVFETVKIKDFQKINTIRQSIMHSTDFCFYMATEFVPSTNAVTIVDTAYSEHDRKAVIDGFRLVVGHSGDHIAPAYNLKHWFFENSTVVVENASLNMGSCRSNCVVDIRNRGMLFVPQGCPSYCGARLIADRRFIDLVDSMRLAFAPMSAKATALSCPAIVVSGDKTLDNLHGYKFPAFGGNVKNDWIPRLRMATNIADKEASKPKPTPIDVMYHRYESFVMLGKMALKFF